KPLSEGMALKNFLKDSRPPAEAPMPTTTSCGFSGLCAVRAGSGSPERPGFAGGLVFFLAAMGVPPHCFMANRRRLHCQECGGRLLACHGATAAIRPSLFLRRGWFLIIVHFCPKSSIKRKDSDFPASSRAAAAARKHEFALAG